MATYLPNSIKYYRKNKNLTQEDLARMLSISVAQFSRYESGESVMPTDKLMKLSSALNVSAEDLMSEREKKEWELNGEGLPMIDISHGEVCRRQFFSGINSATVTISPDGIKFSTACIRKWSQFEYVHLIVIDEDRKLLVVRGRTEEDRDAQKWSHDKDDIKYPRKISGREIPSRIFNLMGWIKGYSYKINGFIGANKFDPDEKMWYFELDIAEGTPMTRKSRIKAGIEDEDLDAENLERLDEIEHLRQEERTARKKLKEQGKPVGPLKKYTIYSDEFGQYTFGLPTYLHDVEPSVGFKT